MANLAELADHPHLEIAAHDVIEPFDFDVDRIYHLACAASPPHYQRDPVHTTLTSVQGTYNALCLARRRDARLLLASTSEVYGDPEVSPQPEAYRGNVSSIGPRACYDEGKRCAESLSLDFFRCYGVEVRVARIFNTYGPHMAPDDGRLVSNLVTQALRGEPLTVYGRGDQTRSLCYVDDMIEGLVSLMESEGGIGPVNLGNPVELPVLAIAQKVAEYFGDCRFVRRPLPFDDPRRRRPDIRLAERLFGFRPRFSLDQGLPPTIEYFRERLGTTARPARTAEQRAR
jgi:UDP-glucuronate decarboxylase